MTDAVIALGQKEQRVRPEAGAPRCPSAVARSASRIQINQVAAVPIQMAGCGVDVAVRPPAEMTIVHRRPAGMEREARNVRPAIVINDPNLRRDLIGNIRATGKIGKIIVGGNVTGNIIVDGATRAPGAALKLLQVGGVFTNGTVNVNGNVTTIKTFGGFGTLGDLLKARLGASEPK